MVTRDGRDDDRLVLSRITEFTHDIGKQIKMFEIFLKNKISPVEFLKIKSIFIKALKT